jgi:ERF superfamily
MSQSENINELATALSKAQGEMQAAIKDKVNPFYKSAYADLGSVWDAARPVLSKYGLCIMQTTEITADKTIMVTILAHTSGQWVKSYLPLNPTKNDSQGMGAAITYLRRYSLSAIMGVVCDEDDDGETASGRGKNNTPAQTSAQATLNPVAVEKIGKAEVTALNDLLKSLDADANSSFFEMINKHFNARTIHEIPKECFDRCMRSLNTKIKYLNDSNRVVA